jgi:hypothetical protein
LEAVYVFGNLGNLAECLGAGWSVEDAFAWAVGTDESELTLPLPGDDLRYVLRFDVRPALFLPKVASQRLTVLAGAIELASLEMKGRQTISVVLPPAITCGRRQIALTFLHPDAVRPADHGAGDDARLLGFCFHSASLAEDGAEAAARAGTPEVGPVHGLIGDVTALQISDVISRLPCLKGRFGVRFVNTSQPLQDATAGLPAAAMETIQFCWFEMSAGAPATRQALRAGLPPDCIMRSFYRPTCQALWPFQGPDSRAIPEPGLYPASRYPYGDRLAQTLAGVEMSAELLLLMYEAAAGKEKLDLDAMFTEDLGGWRWEDEQSDMRLASFISERLWSDRMFISPDRAGPALLREMVLQILGDELAQDMAAPEMVTTELDALLDGYTGCHEELPVHPRVAAHFGLSWWSPDMKYRWMNNLLSHQDYVLNLIKWTPWRP